MMKACGIIAEYNPFHYGHRYQLEEARKRAQADCLIVVMSGNYVQRGEPALVDKWQRAEMALRNGADLVVELPFSVSCQPADKFAEGALNILQILGCSYLAFGTENEQFDYGSFAKKVLPLMAEKNFIVDYRKTFATQWHEFLGSVVPISENQPNQLLALSYALANEKLKTPLTLIPIQRKGVGHDTVKTEAEYGSASLIRKLLLNGHNQTAQQLVPYNLQNIKQPFMDTESFWPLLHYRLAASSPGELADIYQMSEGLENRFYQQNQVSMSWTDLLARVKSKRYTYARLRRLALYTVLNVSTKVMTADFTQDPPIRLLGFNRVGQAYLHQQRSIMTQPPITRVTAKAGAPGGQLGLQIKVDRLYEQLNGIEQNFTKKIIIIE